MPDSLLTIFKFCFLAVLYLFFVRVLRAVWAELRAPQAVAVPAAAPAAARPAAAPKPSWGAARSSSRLRVVEPAANRGQTYDLADELTMGRAAGCQVTIDDTYVSQLHARLFQRDGQYYLEDLGSTNGTYLNRSKVTAPMAIRKGDRLQLGKTVLEMT